MTAHELSKLELTQAKRVLVVANTPLFLLEKLNADPDVVEISRRASPRLILSDLKRRCRVRPRTLRGEVLPYVYLVALSKKPEASAIEAAAKLSAPSFGWYNYLATLLKKDQRSTEIRTINIPSTRIEEKKATGPAISEIIEKVP